MFRRGLWSFFGLLGVLAVAAAAYRGPVFRQEGFRFEAILSAGAADLDGDGRDEVIIVGRNYLDREVCVEVLGWQDGSLVPEWRSPNLLEPESSLLALPVRRREGPPLLFAITRSRFRIICHGEGGYAETYTGPMEFAAEEGTSGDLDGDGQDELVLSATLRNTKSGREKNLRLLSFSPDGLSCLAASAPVGNIRALAAGDLDGDGRAEVIAEVGVTTKPGEFHLFRLEDGLLRRFATQKTLLPAAGYGLAVGPWTAERAGLLAASAPGRLFSFSWTRGSLVKEAEMAFRGSPIALSLGDLDGDGCPEMIIVAYPAVLQVFALEE
ncbi:MAG: FG-GAP repeat domain-containing protein [Bacillota bacterium]